MEATKAGSATPRWVVGSLAAMSLLVVAALSRGLTMSFWRDETATAAVVSRSPGDVLDLLKNAEGGLAGYMAVMKLWTGAAGTSELSLRLPSLLATAATVLLGGLLASRLAGPLAGLTAGVLLVAHPYLNPVYGLEARPYALGTALVTTAALAAHNSSVADQRRDLFFWSAAASAAVASHLLCVLAIAPQLLWLLARPAKRHLRVIGPFLLPPVVIAAVLAVLAARATVLQSWVPTTTFESLRQVGQATVPRSFIFLLLCSVPGLWLLRATRSEPDDGEARRNGIVLAGWILFPLLALAAYSVVGTPTLVARYALPSVVGGAVLIGLAVAGAVRGLRRTPHRLIAAAAGGLMCLAAIGVVVTARNADVLRPNEKEEDLRAAADAVLEGQARRAGIIYSPTWAEGFFRWYLTERAGSLAPVDVTAATAESAVATGSFWTPTVGGKTAHGRLAELDRVWIVGYPHSDWDPVPDIGTPFADSIRSSWELVRREELGITLELWSRPETGNPTP